MRLYRVDIHNYKRLVDTSFYVNGKLTALVGPNEAGKTSVIRALKLMSTTNEVERFLLNRSRPVNESMPILTCHFALEAEDKVLLAGLPIADSIDKLHFLRQRNGRRIWTLEPAAQFDPEIALNAAAAVLDIDERLAAARPSDPEDDDLRAEFNDIIQGHRDALARCREAILADEVSTEAAEWSEERTAIVDAALAVHCSAEPALEAFDHFTSTVASGRSPWDFVYEVLKERPPRFLEFTAAQRDLKFEYNLEEIKQAGSAPVALENLLTVAETGFDELYDTLEDNSRRETLIEDANDRLDVFFARVWTQSRQTVSMRIKGELLELYVRELGKRRAMVDLSERSDGLRAYVALILFLEARSARDDVILLIDEAELHLHYDAQADLLNRLAENTFLTRVIYTTHSPGCLPRDLGTGVRFVVPNPDNGALSQVRHEFWKLGEAGDTGFSPLLLVMGASAATFAHVRRAVVGEGPSEMLLLPSLIRTALAGDSEAVPDLDYQVAPGIAVHASKEFSELREVAVNTAFLIDGDAQGIEYRKQLIEAGVPEQRIVQLESGWSLEDLLPPELYVDALRELLMLDANQLNTSMVHHPYRQVAKKVVNALGKKMPGSIAMSEHLLISMDSEEFALMLSPEQRDKLVDLHNLFLSALDWRQGQHEAG